MLSAVNDFAGGKAEESLTLYAMTDLMRGKQGRMLLGIAGVIVRGAVLLFTYFLLY